jgi:chromatin structure-remodeling complex protein RSC7
VYDVHTNVMQYPKIMQPTHARWEALPPSDFKPSSQLTEGMSTLRLTNGTDGTDEISAHEPEIAADSASSIFHPVPSVFTRRFAITDIHYETPESSTLGVPGPDGDVHDIGNNGLISMADPQHPEFVSAAVLAELPPDCKDALVEAASREWAWKSRWRSEASDAARGAPLKSYAWYP